MASQDPALLWITSRAAGTAAIVCASASVSLGLTMGGRLAAGPGRTEKLKTIHETLAIATLVAIVVHAVALLYDPWLAPGLSGILVPFAMDYRPLFTGLGIIAAFTFAAFALLPFAKQLVGPRWKVLHRFTLVAWLLSAVHVVGSGTDVTEPWYAALLVVCIAPVVLLTFARVHKARPDLFAPTPHHQEETG